MSAKKKDDARKRWLEKIYRPAVDHKPERKPVFETTSGIEIDPVYAAPDEDALDERVGFPGQYPFTRGVYPSMYRGRPWTIRQYAGFGTARQTNDRFQYLLEHGQKGLSTPSMTCGWCSTGFPWTKSALR
jgi:methylmalonyl-CoA mutase N-terminal domain/subunit